MPDASKTTSFHFDIVIAGAGPAGIAAASTAAESTGPRAPQRVLLLDSQPAPGGNIWRGHAPGNAAARWLARLRSARPTHMANATVFAADAAARRLHVETPANTFHISYNKLILATGARELFLPFPGWTLPNVFGVGGLQALVKGGWPIAGKRVVVAGTGPLLLAAAVYFRRQRATVTAILEQTSMPRLLDFAGALATLAPAKLLQVAALRAMVTGQNFRASAWVTAAHGTDRVDAVSLASGPYRWQQPCDYLACSYGLVPNLELAQMLGCRFHHSLGTAAVLTDAMQRTSVGGVYCAGEPGGIGGADAALTEGQIAGYAAAGNVEAAAGLVPAAIKADRFRAALAKAFALRPELKSLSAPDTVICRCEDVPKSRLDLFTDARSAKLHTRCGMGPCQGRICGPVTQFLYNWPPDSTRPPILPVTIASLAQLDA